MPARTRSVPRRTAARRPATISATAGLSLPVFSASSVRWTRAEARAGGIGALRVAQADLRIEEARVGVREVVEQHRVADRVRAGAEDARRAVRRRRVEARVRYGAERAVAGAVGLHAAVEA